MVLAQGCIWRATLVREELVALTLLKEGLPTERQELRELRIEVPLARWNLVVRNVHSDRKLLGGVLLDGASPKELVSTAVSDDRLLAELQRVVLDATVALVEEGSLTLEVPGQKDE
jgi:hypothetical protein